MAANDTQVGGAHYKTEVEHWDWVASSNLDYFQGQITKYVSRWRNKNGLEDLYKARHFLDKYIELQEKARESQPHTSNPLVKPLGKIGEGKFCTCHVDPSTCSLHEEGSPTAGYVNQG